jgi:hypothetical protein
VYYLVDPFTEEAELDKNDGRKIEEFINAGKLLTDPKKIQHTNPLLTISLIPQLHLCYVHLGIYYVSKALITIVFNNQ